MRIRVGIKGFINPLDLNLVYFSLLDVDARINAPHFSKKNQPQTFKCMDFWTNCWGE